MTFIIVSVVVLFFILVCLELFNSSRLSAWYRHYRQRRVDRSLIKEVTKFMGAWKEYDTRRVNHNPQSEHPFISRAKELRRQVAWKKKER